LTLSNRVALAARSANSVRIVSFAGELVLQPDAPHLLGDASDLEVAGDSVGCRDQPVDLAPERGELPDAGGRRTMPARNDHGAESEDGFGS